MKFSYHKHICPIIIDEIVKSENFEAVNYISKDFQPSPEQKSKIFERECAKFNQESERAFIETCVGIFFEATKSHPRNAIKFSDWFRKIYIKKAESTMKEFRDCYDAVFANKNFDKFDENKKQAMIVAYKNAFHQQNNVVRINFNIYRVFKICGKNAYKFTTMQKQFEKKHEMER